MQDGSDSAGWAALVVAAFAMIIAFGQMSQQYASSGQLIRLCDSVVYGGAGGLPGKGKRVWSWSQFRFRVLYDVPMFRFPQGNSNAWDMAPLSSVRFQENVNLVDNEKRWSALSSEPQVGEAAWVSFCRKIKHTCNDRLIITLKHDDADRVPPELPNIPVPVSLKEIVIMALTIGLDCTEASFTDRSLSMQGASGVIASSNHPILGLVVHFEPQPHSALHPPLKHWRHWVARACGFVPVADDVLGWNGAHGLTFYETADRCLQDVVNADLPRETPFFSKSRTSDSDSGYVSDDDHLSAVDDTGSKAEHKDTSTYMRVERLLSGLNHDRDRVAQQQDSWDDIAQSSLSTKNNNCATSERVIVSKGQCSHLKWYWICQMSVFAGYFASPWRDHLDSAICRHAFMTVLRGLLLDESIGLDRVKFCDKDIVQSFDTQVPLASNPPFAVNAKRTWDTPFTRPKSPKDGLPPLPGWHHYPTFERDLPEIAIASRFLSNDFDQSSSCNMTEDNALFVHELMRFDHWLNRAIEAMPIVEGNAQLIRNTPGLIQHVMQHFYEDFKYCYVTGNSGEHCTQQVLDRMRWLGLSEAEITFLCVALLRTLRYADCLGSGLNTKPALQILWHDIAAHMV